ncbi:tRNA lysidine(34) synthetase TilS [Deinococcus navajonensis]|uniref:Multifunctional fusion protein n=1 Tax=Deinococcus navajonensis TaxID=309884 RepID=A0ABV8XRN0_9DEIO
MTSSDLLFPLHPWAGQLVVVGVSGGADSVALLRALVQVGARPVAVHLDHALRPESGQDAHWVVELAGELKVPCVTQRVNVAAVAARRGWNLEDAARRVRYDFLGRAARDHGAHAILTAHTRRDQAETVLMQLLRGESVLRGIAPERGRVRRPWLGVSREEVEVFLRSQGQEWREDPTNADPALTRAWLRAEVLPALRARYPAVEEALARVAGYARQDEEVLDTLARALRSHTPLEGQPLALLRRHVAGALEAAGLTFHASQVEALAGALQTGQTTHLTLPGARDVTVTGGQLHLTVPGGAAPDFAWPADWTLRTRRSGDRIVRPGGTRKLSDVLGELKVPRAARDEVPLLVSPRGVEWVGLTPPLWAAGAREAAGQAPDPLDGAMEEALALAREAALYGEVPVGAVVLGPDGVVGRGRNTSRADGDMTRHAELTALREAARTLGTAYLGRCTLVVTLEPCPMCLGAALEARVGRVVYGARNPKAGALGGVSDLLAHHWGHTPAVIGGVRAREASRLLRETFGQWRREKAEPG